MKNKKSNVQLSNNEAAEYLEKHPYTLANWRYKGKGPRYYKKGSHKNAEIYYLLADLKKFEKSQSDKLIIPKKSDV